jgi:hypothetical protein
MMSVSFAANHMYLPPANGDTWIQTLMGWSVN